MILFGAILIQLRTKAGLSQQKVADQLGIAKSTYNNWESDRRTFAVDFLPKLANVFGVQVVDLFPPDLVVTVSQPTTGENSKSLTFAARQLYEDLIGSQKRTIQLTEENRQLREEIERLREHVRIS